jgi:predicted HTH transcriptional regulator
MPPDEVSVPDDVQIMCTETSIRGEEFARLNDSGVFGNVSYDDEDNTTVDSIDIDVRVLAEFMYQHDTLAKVASQTRVDILHHIRESEYKRHSTQGIAEELEIHPTTASRHLNNLHRDGYLEKEKDGLFIRDID